MGVVPERGWMVDDGETFRGFTTIPLLLPHFDYPLVLNGTREVDQGINRVGLLQQG